MDAADRSPVSFVAVHPPDLFVVRGQTPVLSLGHLPSRVMVARMQVRLALVEQANQADVDPPEVVAKRSPALLQ